MKKILIATFLNLIFNFFSSAQYTDQGIGKLKNLIWWFDWAGFEIKDGASRVFTTNDGILVTITFSKVSGATPVPNVMNTWSGAVLHLLYDFTNQNIQPALIREQTAINSQFTITVTAKRDGIFIPFSFIAADAEASAPEELISLTTNGGNWQTVDFFKNSSQNSNPLKGCNTKSVILTDTYGNAPQTGQNPVLLTEVSDKPLVINVDFERNGVPGGTAIAFGLFAPIDRGDLPFSYGFAHHKLNFSYANSCNYNPPLPVVNIIETLKLGSVIGDADGGESLNDNDYGVDEDALTHFPDYDASGSYSLNVPYSNTSGNNAYLSGWFDYNRDGIFTKNELATAILPNNSNKAVLTWSGLPRSLPEGSVTGFAFRFRIASDRNAIESPAGFAPDGEVEDYFINMKSLCKLQVNTINDTSICSGTPIKLTAQGATTYKWHPSTGLSDTTAASPLASPTTPITYVVEGTNEQGCIARDTVSLNILSLPTITKSADTTICEAGATTLLAGGGVHYAWSPVINLADPFNASTTASPKFTTVYYITVTDINNCTIKDSVKVIVHPKPAFAVQPLNISICKGDSASLTASGGDTFTWLSDLNTPFNTTASVTVKPSSFIIYKVAFTDNTCKLKDTLSIPVDVHQLPLTSVTKSNDIDCSNSEAVLNAAGGIQYLWDKLPGIDKYTTSSPTVNPLTSSTYYVTVTDKNNCSVRDSVKVYVDFLSQKSLHLMPSAFTPNNDGNNDCFGLKYWSDISDLEFSIFNRWGVKVFYTKNPNDCWDGKYKGEPQQSGTFVYVIKAKAVCGIVNKKGLITLIR